MTPHVRTICLDGGGNNANINPAFGRQASGGNHLVALGSGYGGDIDIIRGFIDQIEVD